MGGDVGNYLFSFIVSGWERQLMFILEVVYLVSFVVVEDVFGAVWAFFGPLVWFLCG